MNIKTLEVTTKEELASFVAHFPKIASQLAQVGEKGAFFVDNTNLIGAWWNPKAPNILFWVDHEGLHKKEIATTDKRLLSTKVKKHEQRLRKEREARERKRRQYIARNIKSLTLDAFRKMSRFYFYVLDSSDPFTDYGVDLHDEFEDRLSYMNLTEEEKEEFLPIIEDGLLRGWTLEDKETLQVFKGVVTEKVVISHPERNFNLCLTHKYAANPNAMHGAYLDPDQSYGKTWAE